MAKKKNNAAADIEPSGDQLLDKLIAEHIAKYAAEFTPPELEELPSASQVLALDPAMQAALLAMALDRIEPLEVRIDAYREGKTGITMSDPAWERLDQPHTALVEVIRGLLNRPLPLQEETIIRLLRWPARAAGNKWIQIGEYSYPLKGIADVVENLAGAGRLEPRIASEVRALAKVLRDHGRQDGSDHVAARMEITSIVDACRRTRKVAELDQLLDGLREPLRLRLAFMPSQLGELLKLAAEAGSLPMRMAILPSLLGTIERATGSGSLSPEHRQHLTRIHQQLAKADKPEKKAADKLISRIDALVDDSILSRLKPDGGWADGLRAWFDAQNPDTRGQWNALLHAAAEVRPEPPVTDWRELTITGYSLSEADFAADRRLRLARGPAAAWRERMAGHVNQVGRANLLGVLRQVLAMVPGSKASTMVQQSINRELLRGLLWLSADVADAELVQAIVAAAKHFYRNNSPLGEASTVVLFHIGTGASAAALATLARAVRSEGQRTFLETGYEMLAEKLGEDPTDLGDDGVPTFGFTKFGALKRDLGAARAELRIEGRAVEVSWFKADGTPLKSVPTAVKREHANGVESVKATAAGVREALGGLSGRLESSWLTGKTWRFENWREQLIDHFVAGTLGRRLIWTFDDGKRQVVGIWQNDGLVDLQGRKVRPATGTTVSLWHPMHASVDEVRGWRGWLEANSVTQPFKQAHREVYVLTAAERATGTYSNRFAAHILRQAQFRQLAKTRGWKAELVGPWDGGDQQHAERKLSRWKLRAEFWVLGAGEEMQTGFTYIATDQVRFYRLEAGGDPLPLADSPPLVFSEVMRDVDLFVGVASVGNNPNWADGGPNGQYREYWESFSFGELGATAQTRRAMLETLVPKLSIAKHCKVLDRFLQVKGELRTYKIHLGSGNILMSPNDQYLCIVPKRGDGVDRVFLPFEGDGTLSVILSKAFMLAEDKAIKDPTIVSQLKK